MQSPAPPGPDNRTWNWVALLTAHAATPCQSPPLRDHLLGAAGFKEGAPLICPTTVTETLQRALRPTREAVNVQVGATGTGGFVASLTKATGSTLDIKCRSPKEEIAECI